jgi:LacI family transcriptional regulator
VVEQDPRAIGRLAAEQVFARLADGQAAIKDIVVPVQLIPRGSGEIPGPFADR